MALRGGVNLALAVALASMTVITLPGVARADPGGSFCGGGMARDYERPLRSMPAENLPPEVGELPFGPRNLTIYSLSTKMVLPGSEIGYEFGAKNAGRRTLHLRWDVTATMLKVDRSGEEIAPVKRIHRRLPKTRNIGRLRFAFPAERAGFYKVELKFKNLDGRQLGLYREYYRVLAPRASFRMTIARRVYRPGEIAHARVENLGTIPVALRDGMPIERAGADCWRRQRNPLERRGPRATSFRWRLRAGEAAPCIAFRIPRDAKPGLYRYKAKADVIGRSGGRVLTAQFRVVRRKG